MWGGDRDATATRIGVEVAAVTILGIIALLLFNPTLGPSGTVLVVVVLIGLDVVLILALLGAFPRIRAWWQDRRSRVRLNRDLFLVREMVRLISRTNDALYENRVGSLLYMTSLLTMPDQTLMNEVQRYAQALRGLVDMSQTRGPWTPNRFALLVRTVVTHFQLAESVLDRLYAVAANKEVTDNSLAVWESFREQYNQLRSDWQRLSDRMQATIHRDAQVRGAPARALQPLRVTR